MNGFSRGAAAGVVVGAAALAALSLVGPPEDGPGAIATVEQTPVAPGGAGTEGALPGKPAEPARSEAPVPSAAGRDAAAEEGPEVADADVPEPPVATEEAVKAPASAPPATAVEEAEPAPLVAPVATEPVVEADAPEVADTSAAIPPGGSAPETGAAGTEAAETKAAETEPAETEPAETGAPPLASVTLSLPDPADAEPVVAAPPAPELSDEGTATPVARDVPSPDVEVARAEPTPSLGTPLVILELDGDVIAGSEAPATPEVAGPLVQAEPAPDEVAVPDAAPIDEPAPSALPGRVTVGGSALPGRDAVQVNRPGAEAPAEEPATAVSEEVQPSEAPALRRYAAAWEPPSEGRPLLSLVLLDDAATDPQAVAALPWPVSVALDPSAPDAAERMAAYRAAGVEALVLARLPEGAQPVDMEVFLGAALERLPETVAVLDLGEGGLGGRDTTAQMGMSRVARDGRGIVLGDQGLRSGLDLAGREGVPAAEVLRDLDGAGQDGAAIRRALDDAVRRAGQEGEAVVLGRVRPETLAALAEWSQEGRAGEVTVAPVSGVLER